MTSILIDLISEIPGLPIKLLKTVYMTAPPQRINTESDLVNSLVDFISRDGDLFQCDLKFRLDPFAIIARLREQGIFHVRCSDGDFSTIKQAQSYSKDRSHESSRFGFHVDGFYLNQPPSYVLLYCVEPGMSDSPTLLADVELTLTSIGSSFDTIAPCEITYYAKDESRMTKVLVSKHSRKIERRSLNLVTRGHLSMPPQQPITMIPDMEILYRAFMKLQTTLWKNPAWKVGWSPGRLIVFDNETFVHARGAQVDCLPDTKRELVRVWFCAQRTTPHLLET